MLVGPADLHKSICNKATKLRVCSIAASMSDGQVCISQLRMENYMQNTVHVHVDRRVVFENISTTHLKRLSIYQQHTHLFSDF